MPDMNLTITDRFIAEQACRDVVARAAQCVDSLDFPGFASLFAEHGVLTRPGAAPLTGRAAIVASYEARPASRITRHLVTNTVVTMSSELAASARSYVLLYIGDASSEQTPFGRRAHSKQVVGEFADNFESINGQWLIIRREAMFVLFNEP